MSDADFKDMEFTADEALAKLQATSSYGEITEDLKAAEEARQNLFLNWLKDNGCTCSALYFNTYGVDYRGKVYKVVYRPPRTHVPTQS